MISYSFLIQIYEIQTLAGGNIPASLNDVFQVFVCEDPDGNGLCDTDPIDVSDLFNFEFTGGAPAGNLGFNMGISTDSFPDDGSLPNDLFKFVLIPENGVQDDEGNIVPTNTNTVVQNPTPDEDYTLGTIIADIPGEGDGGQLVFSYEDNTYGCTDSGALNYDAEAIIDDGSCEYPVVGCYDESALNYNPQVTQGYGGIYIDNSLCQYYNPTVSITPASIDEPSIGIESQEFQITYTNLPNPSEFSLSINHANQINSPFSYIEESLTDSVYSVTINIPANAGLDLIIGHDVTIERNSTHEFGEHTFETTNPNPVTVPIGVVEDVTIDDACTDPTATNYYCYGYPDFSPSSYPTANTNLCPGGNLPPGANFTGNNSELCHYPLTFTDISAAQVQQYDLNYVHDSEERISIYISDSDITNGSEIGHITSIEIEEGGNWEYSTVTYDSSAYIDATNVVEFKFIVSGTENPVLGNGDPDLDGVTESPKLITLTDQDGVTYQIPINLTILPINNEPVFYNPGPPGLVLGDDEHYERTIDEDDEVTFNIFIYDADLQLVEDSNLIGLAASYNENNIDSVTITAPFTLDNASDWFEHFIQPGLIKFIVNVVPKQNFYTTVDEVIEFQIEDYSPNPYSPLQSRNLYLTVNRLLEDRPVIPANLEFDVFSGEETVVFNLPCQSTGTEVPDHYLIMPFRWESAWENIYFPYNESGINFSNMTNWQDGLYPEVFAGFTADGTEISNLIAGGDDLPTYYDTLDEDNQSLTFDEYILQLFSYLELPGDGVYLDSANGGTYNWFNHMYVIPFNVDQGVVREDGDDYDSYLTISYLNRSDIIQTSAGFYYTCGVSKRFGEVQNDQYNFLYASTEGEAPRYWIPYDNENVTQDGLANLPEWFIDPTLQDLSTAIPMGKVTFNFQFGEFPGEFGIPGVDIEPSLNESYDPYSGMEIDTSTLINTEDGFDNSDNDKRPSLGCFSYDEDNLSPDEFLYNIEGDEFETYEKTNFVANGTGRQSLRSNMEAGIYEPGGGWGYINATGWKDGAGFDGHYYQNCESDFGQTPGDGLCEKHVGWEDYIKFILNENPNNSNYLSHSGPGTWAKWVINNPECYSYRKCLYMESTSADFEKDQYIRLNQYQKILTSAEASSLLNRFSPLRVSFWMKTKFVDNVDNPPAIELAILGMENSDFDVSDETRYDPRGLFNSEGESVPFHYNGSRIVAQNSEIDQWEKFEYTFVLPREYLTAVGEYRDLYLTVNWTTTDYSQTNHGEVYLDNFEVVESYDFRPDVDVRVKEGSNMYSEASLTEYYDPKVDLDKYRETMAPLEAQFYFYPRYPIYNPFDLTEDENSIVHNDFRKGAFYLYDVDWGDGSSKDFTNEPILIGDNISVFHTYEKSGIFEVTGYMFRTKLDQDTNESLGIVNNQRFTLRINVNEGLDEDFTYFGSDGFSYIPYKNTLPVVGGISNQSAYYKGIKRELGFITDDTKVSTYFEKETDKLKTELALLKMDSDSFSDLDSLPEFEIIRYEELGNTSSDVVTTGITDLQEELGKSIGDTDLTNIRYFNKPFQLYEMLGFEDVEGGIPDNDRYWKNIAPTFEDILDGGYYYPVLPVYNQVGEFIETELQDDKIPFGSIEYDGETWSPVDLLAPITKEDLEDSSLKININSNQVENNVLLDSSGNQNYGFTISDYKVTFNQKTREAKKIKNTSRIRTSKNNGAF